jgi:hypothetical protein
MAPARSGTDLAVAVNLRDLATILRRLSVEIESGRFKYVSGSLTVTATDFDTTLTVASDLELREVPLAVRKMPNLPECFASNPGPQQRAENDCATCSVRAQCLPPASLWAPKGLRAIEWPHSMRRHGERCRLCVLGGTSACPETPCHPSTEDMAHPSGKAVYFVRDVS